MQPSIEVLTLRDPAFHQLASFESDLFREWLAAWQRLGPVEKDAFTHPVWAVSWLAAFARDTPERFALAVVRRGGDLLTAFPVEMQMRRGVLGRRLGLRHPFNPHSGGASLAAPEGSHAAVFDALFASRSFGGSRPLLVRFPKVEASNALLQAPISRLVQPAGSRYTIELGEGWEDLRSRLSRKFKNALRTARNHLNRLPDLEFTEATSEPGLSRDYRDFIELEARGWKGGRGEKEKRGRGRALGVRDDLRDFYDNGLAGLAKCGAAAVHLLRTQGRAIGGLVSFHHDDVLVILRIAHDEAHQKHSPGHLVLAHVFEHHCPALGLRRVNCVGSPAWLDRWRPESSPQVEVIVLPPGLRGRWARRTALAPKEQLRLAMLGRPRLARLGRRLRGEEPDPSGNGA